MRGPVILPVIDERDLVHGDPIDEASHNAMSTAFTLRSALGQIARKMRDADPTEREMVALLMRDIAIRPDEVDATLGRLFQIVGISAEQTAATGASAVSKAADPPATGPPPAPAQSSRPVTPLHGAHDGRRQASRLIGNERNRPASQPRKTSSKK